MTPARPAPRRASCPPVRRAGLLLLLAAPLLAGFSPLAAEDADVREGNERLSAGDAAAALSRYDAAERARGPAAEIDFDRGDALFALGRHAEARDAWTRAAERAAGSALASRALQNLGSALDALGDRDGARRALARALARDPGNEDARYNLEVLLRRREAERPTGGGQRRPEEGQPQDGQGQGQDRRAGAPPGATGDRRDQARKDAKRDEGRREGEPGASEERGESGGAAERAGQEREGGERHGAGRPGTLRAQDAERLLDALRDRERQMPLGPAGRAEARRRDVERDW